MTNLDDPIEVTDVDDKLLQACLHWDGKQHLEELPDLQEWANESPRNLKVVRVFEGLLRRERMSRELADRDEAV